MMFHVSSGENTTRPSGYAIDRDLGPIELDREIANASSLRVEQHDPSVAVTIVSSSDHVILSECDAGHFAFPYPERSDGKPLTFGAEQHNAADSAPTVTRRDDALGTGGNASYLSFWHMQETTDFGAIIEQPLQDSPSFEGVCLFRSL